MDPITLAALAAIGVGAYFFLAPGSSGGGSSSGGGGSSSFSSSGPAGRAAASVGDKASPSPSSLPFGADDIVRATTKDGDFVDIVHFPSVPAAASYASSVGGAAHNGYALVFPPSMSVVRRHVIFTVYAQNFDAAGLSGLGFLGRRHSRRPGGFFHAPRASATGRAHGHAFRG